MIDNIPNIPRITAWIEDLESGEYAQAQGALGRTSHGDLSTDGENAVRYCCLGVAVKTAKRLGYTGDVDWTRGILDSELTAWFGLDNMNPVLTRQACTEDHCDEDDGDHSYNVTATNANDDHEWPFETIAGHLRVKYDIPRAEQVSA